MKNRLIRMDKPHIRRTGGLWACGILLECLGRTPIEAYNDWLACNS